MSLTPGTRVGPYEIVGAIGAGGMGEVYRARDSATASDSSPSALERDLKTMPRRPQ